MVFIVLIIYVHGFNSSPASFKARCFSEFLADNYPHNQFAAPELSDYPQDAIKTLSGLIERSITTKRVVLLGSSLGGFYSTYLSQKYQLKAVLVNPAVNPQELLIDSLGKNKNYHTGIEYEFSTEHIEQLEAIYIKQINSPKKLLVMLQKGDEVLDYRLAEKKYCESNLIIEPGGNHSFQNFAQHCEKIYQFLRA